MPYIKFSNRAALDVIVDGLVNRLRSIKCVQGDINYIVTRVALEALKPETGWSYHSLSSAVAALKDAATEIERRLLGPYEDRAILKNGDMRCYQEPFSYKPERPPVPGSGEPIESVAKSLAEKVEKQREEAHKARGTT